jgi:hypothetical protein
VEPTISFNGQDILQWPGKVSETFRCPSQNKNGDPGIAVFLSTPLYLAGFVGMIFCRKPLITTANQ